MTAFRTDCQPSQDLMTTLHHNPRRGVALLLPLLAAACVDGTPLTPTLEAAPAEVTAALQCSVDVPSAAMTCTALQPGGTQGISATRIFGSQERNVKLTNVGGSTGPGTFEINVTVQNLTPQALGTSDGSTVSGIDVFFSSGPNVTVGTGDVAVANATGTGFFTAAGQEYFHYNEILQPNEISASQPWQFTLTGTVTRFSFIMLISASQPNEALNFVDRVWDGSTSSDWTDGTNWAGGVAPDSGSTVLILADSLFAGSMPTLPADAQVTNLRVGFGSTLTLAGYTLTAWGNVDGAGSITGGTLWVRGTNAILSGNLPSVRVSSGASLQAATRTSGAVSISDGSLVVNGSAPLSISIP